MSISKNSLQKKIVDLPRRTKLTVVFSVLGTIVVIVLISLIVIDNQKSPRTMTADELKKSRYEAALKQVQREGAVRDLAKEAIKRGDFNKANQIYADAIRAETVASRKVQLAIDYSGILYDIDKYDEAIKVALDAEAYSSDKYMIADWLSRMYEDQRQYQLAAKYYTTAGKFASSQTNEAGFNKSYYDQEAARVSALVRK